MANDSAGELIWETRWPSDWPIDDDRVVATAAREPGDEAAVWALLARAAAIGILCAEEAATLDEEGRFPHEAFARIAAAGLLAAPLPRASGGLGLGCEPGRTLPLLQTLQLLGRGD